MTSFRKFLTESSNNFSKSNREINEELGVEGVKELQSKELEIQKKIKSIKEKLKELQDKRELIQKRMSKYLVEIMNAFKTGENFSQFEKGYEEAQKELGKIEKDTYQLFDKMNSYYDEVQKINSDIKKMVIKDFFGKKRMNEATTNKYGKYEPKNREELKALANDKSVHLGDIDVSNVNDLSGLFEFSKRIDFSGIENWDVSHVTDMSRMFSYCYHFNEPIGKWDVSKVKNMSKMFNECRKFNQPLDRWNVESVVDMSFMFANCENFNQPLNKWNVSKVKYIQGMFEYCEKFNQPLDRWNIKKVISHTSTFTGTRMSKEDVSKWAELNHRIDLDNLFKD